MEFGKYLSKGLWGLADKALPVVYGVAYVVLVIRVLPEEEFGNYVLIQEIFLIVTGLATAFALQPLLKYAAETSIDQRQIISAAFVLNLMFIAVATVMAVATRNPLGALMNSAKLADLMLYLPAMFAASFIRNFSLILLQSTFRTKALFWTDAVHFIGAPLLIWVVSRMHLFDTALDLILINIASLSASSIVAFVVTRTSYNITLRPSRVEVKRMWDYGKYTFGGILSYLFYSKSDTFILSAFTGPVQVAVYNSVKVFVRIYDMVAQVMQMFILPAVSRISSQGDSRSLKVLVEKAITFGTVAMLPVFLLFVFFASPLIGIVYQGRYTEAIPLLRLFSALCFFVPLTGVATNTLLGLGHARIGFVISVQFLVISTVVYFITIPLFDIVGATLGFVIASLVLAVLVTIKMKMFVPVTLSELLERRKDIFVFLRHRLAMLGQRNGIK